jgi:hypothetical protein
MDVSAQYIDPIFKGHENVFPKHNINYEILKYTDLFPYYIINITGV